MKKNIKKDFKKDLKIGSLVAIHWSDIFGDFNTQSEDINIIRCVSIGMVHEISIEPTTELEQVKLNACIFECEYKDHDFENPGNVYGDIIAIPTCVIRKVEVLKADPKLFD